MAITLKDMMEKAERKGWKAQKSTSQQDGVQATRPWQENSLQFNKAEKEKNIHTKGIRKNGSKTNQTQTEHKAIHKPTQIQAQKHTQEQKYTQSEHKEGHEAGTKPCSKQYTINRIRGLQKSILVFLYLECKKNRSLISRVISKDEISKKLVIKQQSVHTTIQRLVDKKLLIRNHVIYGRSGATTYELPDFVYDDMSNNEILFKDDQKSSNPYTNTATKTGYSSSNNLNITTTNNDLPENWKIINIEPLAEVGFTVTQLKQLYSSNQNIPETVQESINHFAYGLANNPTTQKYKEKGKALWVLMGVLRKGGSWNESDYETPKDKALREKITRKKIEKEKRDRMINELIGLEFDEWKANLTKDEIENIIPPEFLNSRMEAPKTQALKSYFRNNYIIKKLKNEGLL